MAINAISHEGRTALHACYANAAHAEMLLDAGADPTVKERKHPYTAFLHAVLNGSVVARVCVFLAFVFDLMGKRWWY